MPTTDLIFLAAKGCRPTACDLLAYFNSPYPSSLRGGKEINHRLIIFVDTDGSKEPFKINKSQTFRGSLNVQQSPDRLHYCVVPYHKVYFSVSLL